ncbi:MAG TPA: ATP-binding protein [Stellaceae bacterium]|nr:ATP-binding protein [Stellaceae bacterium]
MAAETSHKGTQPQQVLIVDDDQEFAESLADILAPAGFAAVIADGAEAATRALQQAAPPVAMLDIRLGRSSGVDLLSHLRAQRPDLICVMMTAHADTQTAIAAMRQGAYDYFDKSAEPGELLLVLDRCFEKYRLQEENRRAYDALRIAKEAAEKANRAKSEFLANISHELRTPLNAIIGFSEVMMQGILGPVGNESYVGYLKDIHDSGIDLLNIINDILDLSKAESGKLELSEQTVDVPTVLDSVCRLMSTKIEGSGLTIETSFAPKLSLLFCDRLKLKQVVLNVLSNAVKFTPQGGRIAISADSAPESGFKITIRDTGIGIAKEDIPRVLLPFEQVESSLSRTHNGTGLGLPLTAAMMMLHGGSIDIDSEIDKGTTVTLSFPAARLVDARDGADALAVDDAAEDALPPRRGYG